MEYPPRMAEDADQAEIYRQLMADYVLTADKADNYDYLQIGEVDGIKYYMPNDEYWGAIIAVSHTDKLACNHGFYEMDDTYSGNDYARVVHNGELKCLFETWK